GDLIDSRRYNEKPSLLLMEKLVEIAPVYYVNGNHEWRSGKFDSLEEKLEKIGVHVLRNDVKEISGHLQLIGIDDPGLEGPADMITKNNITSAMDGTNQDNYQILLAHRPELISIYSDFNVDLVLSGHAHGG